jgi:hypothetical protein
LPEVGFIINPVSFYFNLFRAFLFILVQFTVEESAALVLLERVSDAQRIVTHKCREVSEKKNQKRKGKPKEEDDEKPLKKVKRSRS